MSTTLAAVDGMGPVRVRCLDEDAIGEIVSIDGLGDRTAALVERGLVDPPLTMALAWKLGTDPDLCARVCEAIRLASWPAGG